MWKVFLSGTAALVLAGSTLVYAQDRGSRFDSGRRGTPSAEDLQSYADARLAALRAGLSLTAQQQVHWPAYEAAVRELQKQRIARAAAQQRDAQAPSTDLAERMRTRGTAMADMGTALKKLADATEPLYKSLDDNQKRRFAALSRAGGPRHHGDGSHHGDRHHGGPRFRG
jgi:Fe-S cluster assembly scaffold protein SufB